MEGDYDGLDEADHPQQPSHPPHHPPPPIQQHGHPHGVPPLGTSATNVHGTYHRPSPPSPSPSSSSSSSHHHHAGQGGAPHLFASYEADLLGGTSPAQASAAAAKNAAGPFPSTSSSFYSGRLSPRFSLPSSSYPTHGGPAHYSSLLSLVSSTATAGSGGGKPTGGTASSPPYALERPLTARESGSKEAREREKLEKKERKKWTKLKNKVAATGESTSPTNSLNSNSIGAALASTAGKGSDIKRNPERPPIDLRAAQAAAAAVEAEWGRVGGNDAARRHTAAAIAAAAASVANGMDSAGASGTAYMDEPTPHPATRYRSRSVVKRAKAKELRISGLSNPLLFYENSGSAASTAAQSAPSVPIVTDEVESPMNSSTSSASCWGDAIVKLNIGGVKYTTSRTTLMRLPNTYFTILLSGKFPALRDSEGAFFIDRDGSLFDPILSFLRTNHLKIPKNMTLEEVLSEMEFYGMTELSEHIASSMVSTHSGYKYFMCQLPRPEIASHTEEVRTRKKSQGKEKQPKKVDKEQSSSSSSSTPVVPDGQQSTVIATSGVNTTSAGGPSGPPPPPAASKKPSSTLERGDALDDRLTREESSTGSAIREHAHTKVTHLCSKFNILCAAYEDGTIACWKYENMALGWRLMFMESQCLPTADGLIMSATMTTTGQYTNLYLAVYSKQSASVCVWDQLHLKSGVKWGVLQLELNDIISCNFMVNNCYLVAISSDNSICIFDLREPPERNKVIYMCAPSHAISPSPSSFGPSSPRAPRELSARSMELSKKDRVMCVAVVDPFSFLGFDDGTICELAQHFNSHTHWEWVVAETWEDIDREVIKCLSCVVFTDRHGSNVLLTYGTEEGSVRLCSKVVNTRNFKLIFSAKGHHDQPINQVMISESHKSGGGLIFSSLSAGGTIKVWRYLYVDLPQPHVSCIACYNSGGGGDHFIYNSGLTNDLLTQMVFLERNLENIDGREIEGRVESHLCVITDAENALTLYDDYYCVCTIKPVDGSRVTSCCVVSYDDLAAPKPYVRNQFITGNDNGSLQVWDLDLAFHHNKLSSSHHPHHPYSFYPFYYAFHQSHGVSHPIKTAFK